MADTQPLRTYSTDVRVTHREDAALCANAALYARVKHHLHAALERAAARGEVANSLDYQKDFLRRFGISRRFFSSVRIEVDGMRRAVREAREMRLETTQHKLARYEALLARLRAERSALKPGAPRQIKLSRRVSRIHDSVERLQARVRTLTTEAASERVSLCFGSAKRFNAQHHLKDNAFQDLPAWRKDWRNSRRNQFHYVGTGSEAWGNQMCQASPNEAGALRLRLRLSDALAGQHPLFVTLRPAQFEFGKEDILAAFARQVPLSYRFIRKAPGLWRVSVAVPIERDIAPATFGNLLGSIGVDINSGFLIAAEIDRHGNRLQVRRLNTPECGRTQHQRDAARGEAVKELVQWAERTGKPIVLEALELEKKKRARNTKTRRKVSALAYRAIRAQIEARAFDKGVEVRVIDPAYSSVQGQLLAVKQGLTVHGGAALVLARRTLGYREHLPQPGSLHRLDARGKTLWWRAPVRMPAGTGPTWRTVGEDIQQALAAHYRDASRRQPPDSCESPAVIEGGSPSLNGEVQRELALAGW